MRKKFRCLCFKTKSIEEFNHAHETFFAQDASSFSSLFITLELLDLLCQHALRNQKTFDSLTFCTWLLIHLNIRLVSFNIHALHVIVWINDEVTYFAMQSSCYVTYAECKMNYSAGSWPVLMDFISIFSLFVPCLIRFMPGRSNPMPKHDFPHQKFKQIIGTILCAVRVMDNF